MSHGNIVVKHGQLTGNNVQRPQQHHIQYVICPQTHVPYATEHKTKHYIGVMHKLTACEYTTSVGKRNLVHNNSIQIQRKIHIAQLLWSLNLEGALS